MDGEIVGFMLGWFLGNMLMPFAAVAMIASIFNRHPLIAINLGVLFGVFQALVISAGVPAEDDGIYIWIIAIAACCLMAMIGWLIGKRVRKQGEQ